MSPSCHSLRIELQIYLHEYCVSFCFLVGCKLAEGCLVCLFSFYFWSLHCAPPPHIPQRLLYKFTRTPCCHHCTVPSHDSLRRKKLGLLKPCLPWGKTLSFLCPGDRSLVFEAHQAVAPSSRVLWAIEKGLHGGTGPCLVGLSRQVPIRHCLRNDRKPCSLILLSLCILLPLWRTL